LLLTRKGLVYLLLMVIIGSAGILLWLVRRALYPFFLACIIAYLLHPVTRTLQARGMKRLTAILLAYLLAFGLMVFFCLEILPLLFADLQDFSQMLPAMIQRSESIIGQLGDHYQSLSLPLLFRQEVDEALLLLQHDLTAFLSDLASMTIGLFRYAMGILISPILAFYLLYDWDHIKDGLVLIVPRSGRRQVVTLIKDLDDVLAGVVRGQLLVAFFVGLCVTGCLLYLNVPYALLIGFMAGVLDVIPYFGAVLGAVPAVTVALLTSPAVAFKVGVLFFIIHQLEGTVIGPKILGDSVGLHPLLVIFCLFAGGELFGVSGMLLAVPIAAILKVCLHHLIGVII
jgi:predicted PurR-regulated permease PerM